MSKLKSLFVESSFESLLLLEIPGAKTACKDGLIVKFDLYFFNLKGLSALIPSIGNKR